MLEIATRASQKTPSKAGKILRREAGMSGRQRIRRQRGFTLLEVFVAVALLVVGTLGMYASIRASAILKETAGETNAAMFKLQATVEYIMGMPFDEIVKVFPDGTAVAVETLVDSLGENDRTLQDEQVCVTYRDHAADPLFFTVTVTWTSRSGTPRSEHLSAARAR